MEVFTVSVIALSKKVTRLRGMYDVLPDDVWIWQRLEKVIVELLSQYGYREIRFPILEQTALFQSAIGEVTDVVEKEMFSFQGRSGDAISMRPEGTASVVRAALQNSLIFNQPQKLWYQGAMFRYERPQKGRNRQFSQVGAEVFGYVGPDIDAELLLLTARMWQALGIPNIRLELNTLGTADCRAAYRQVLIEFFEKNVQLLDQDAKRRLHSNPLRILDSKNPQIQTLIKDAPQIQDCLNDEAKQHFDGLCEILEQCDISFSINRNLVRGLDYYTHNVFEWITDDLGTQGTICGGGRYDRLVEMQGGKPTPATGFAMGVDRLVELIVDLQLWQAETETQVYWITDKLVPAAQSLSLSEQLRRALPGLKLTHHMGDASFKSQFKKADKSGAAFAVILGEQELAEQVVTVKSLRNREIPQQTMNINQLSEFLQQQLSKQQ